MTIPRWVQLIRAHQSGQGDKPSGYGLGIAFLVGASRPSQKSVQTSPDQVRAEIDALLTSFLEETPSDHIVCLDRCGEVMKDSPVAALAYSVMPTAKGFISKSQSRPTLLLGRAFESEGVTSVPELANKLFHALHQHICHGRFSFRGGMYRSFSESDLQLIESSKRL